MIDATVDSVNSYGFQCSVAHMLSVHVNRSNFPPDLIFKQEAWASEDGEVQIRPQCGVRLRIKSVRYQDSRLVGVGTINDHFCGQLFRAGNQD